MTINLPTLERRRISLAESGCQLRESKDAEPLFVGHAAVFDSRTSIGNPLTWGFYEEVSRGAFSKTLGEGDARFLVDHDTGKPVSRVSAGTLRLAEDKRGLAVDSDLNEKKSYVADLVENLRDGTVTGMSFGFRVIRDAWETVHVETVDGDSVEAELRKILEAQLLEVSAVTFPAYEATDAGIRSLVGPDGLAVLDVAAALIRRGDAGAFESRCALRAEFADFRHLFTPAPAAATRDAVGEPGAPTPLDTQARMRGLAARYRLPTGTAGSNEKP